MRGPARLSRRRQDHARGAVPGVDILLGHQPAKLPPGKIERCNRIFVHDRQCGIVSDALVSSGSAPGKHRTNHSGYSSGRDLQMHAMSGFEQQVPCRFPFSAAGQPLAVETEFVNPGLALIQLEFILLGNQAVRQGPDAPRWAGRRRPDTPVHSPRILPGYPPGRRALPAPRALHRYLCHKRAWLHPR